MQMLSSIQNRIYEIRGERVMLDFDLAALYEVETKALNQAVKRNTMRFPEDFMFRLSGAEWEAVRSQIVTASENRASLRSQSVTSKRGGIRYTPFAFTEHGVTMLASVLKSEKAVKMSIAVVRAFIVLKQLAIEKRADFSIQLRELREELTQRLNEHDSQLNNIYDALENLLDKETDKEAEKANWEKRQRIGFKK